jgi:hypothetical protein
MPSVHSENTRPAKRHKAVSVDCAAQTPCPICLEVMDAASEKPLTLRCGHVYHYRCVLSQRARTCALCRKPVSKNVWHNSDKTVPPLKPPADEITEEQLIADEDELPLIPYGVTAIALVAMLQP